MTKTQKVLSSTMFLLPSLTVAGTLNFTDFSSPAGVTVNQTAQITANRLRVTNDTQGVKGSAWFNAIQAVNGPFTAQFDFQMAGGAGPFGLGDGFAFVIQNAAAGTGAIGSGINGGSIGITGLSNSFAIEFNSYSQHLSAQSCGTGANSSSQDSFFGTNCNYGAAVTSAVLADKQIHRANVNYDGAVMTVSLDGNSPLLSRNVALGSFLNLASGTNAYLGFSASSGGATQNADILNFTFTNATPEPGTFGLIGVGIAAVMLARRR